MWRSAWVCLAFVLAGCAAGPVNDELGLCSSVCRCAVPLAGAQRTECVETCLDVSPFPPACGRCVLETTSACGDMLATCFLGGPCDPPVVDDTEAGDTEAFDPF